MEEVGCDCYWLAITPDPRRWVEHRLVDNSDDEDSVELYPMPDSPSADALYDSYLKRLRAEARDVSVGLMLDNSTLLPD
jgi:hypothetical protein